MSIFPFIDGQAGIEVIENDQLPIFKEIDVSFETGTIKFENGSFKILEGKEALRVWIYKAIKTSRFEYDIYSWNFGSEINSLIGKGYSKALIEAEVRRYISEALLLNEYIEEVNYNNIAFKGDTLSIECMVLTVYGEIDVKINF